MTKSEKIHFTKEIIEELSSRKSIAERRLLMHKKDVSENHPEIAALIDEIGEISFDLSLKITQSPDDAESIGKLLSEITAKKRAELEAMLIKAGLPKDYLERKPVCEVCGDTGAVDGEMCRCVKRFLIGSRFPGSGLIPNQTFETFRHDLVSDPRERRFLENVFNYCMDYADRFPENPLPDVMIIGKPGIGKTFLLNCIGDRVLKRGYSVLRITANKLVSSVMNSITNREEMPDFVMPDLLILDDLGTEPMIPNVTIETLLSTVCERQDGFKATLVATNKDPSMLNEDYGDRVLTRLFSPQRVKVIEMNTPVIRFMKT